MPDNHTAKRPAFIEEIRSQSQGYATRPARRSAPASKPLPDPDTVSYLFTVYTGNRWLELAEREPKARMLFGEFWHQGELCILFADTNAGKSVLAVQIADNLTRSRNTGPFANKTAPGKVLYIDFELSTRQFHQRYSGPQGNYQFEEHFYRAGFNPSIELEGDATLHDQTIIAALEDRITQLKASVLIIDNITCLRGGTENASVALRLMKNLKHLKTTHNLSILVLAHTPKRRNPGRPLSADDLQGSKLLINFADSAFTIATSHADSQLRYLKQIKQRNTAGQYGAENVCLCRISNTTGFLQFNFEGYSTEAEQQRPATQTFTASQRKQFSKQIANLKAGGHSQRQISRQLGISLGTVNKLSQS